MSTKTLPFGFLPVQNKVKTPEAPAPKPAPKNEVAKPDQKAVDAHGRYQTSFETGKQVNRDYTKTYSHGDTSDLFTPNSKPSKLGSALGMLPSISRDASFDKRVTGLQTEGGFNALGGLAQGAGRVSVGEAYVHGDGHVGIEGGALKANGDVEASATALDASGSLHIGKGDYALDAQGEAYVGARAKATGELTIDPAKGIYAAKVGGEAFAGARAGVEANVNVGQFGGAGARAEAWAGVGAAAHAELGFKNGRFKARFDLGAALGVGFKFGFNVDIDVKGITDTVKSTVEKVVKAPVEAVKNVGHAISEGVKKLKFW